MPRRRTGGHGFQGAVNQHSLVTSRWHILTIRFCHFRHARNRKLQMKHKLLTLLLLLANMALTAVAQRPASPSAEQLARWLKRFPEADTNGDGKLSVAEARAYRNKIQGDQKSDRGGVPRQFTVDPRWEKKSFPEDAVSLKSPDEIRQVYAELTNGPAVTSYPRPADGSLRIIGTGHSFMGPGYQTLPRIAQAAGLKQPPLFTHTGGGITGSARYKWEQENGIFQFQGRPLPKLLASLSNAQWDAMTWGPYFQDRPQYYECWVDFALQYNPEMKFYLSDAWPQLDQLDELPTSPDQLTPELFERLGREKNTIYGSLVRELRKKYGERVFIMPTSDAMVLAVRYFHEGKLPGVEGVHRVIGNKERSLWRDRLGHLGPGFDQLEGYVFYATLYRKSPELIEKDISFAGVNGFPSPRLDRAFREIAWKAVLNNPLSGVSDKDHDGLGDE